jgi:hypothetical protein
VLLLLGQGWPSAFQGCGCPVADGLLHRRLRDLGCRQEGGGDGIDGGGVAGLAIAGAINQPELSGSHYIGGVPILGIAPGDVAPALLDVERGGVSH